MKKLISFLLFILSIVPSHATTTVLAQGARNPVTGYAAYGGAKAYGDGVHDDTQALRDALTLGRGATSTPQANNWNPVAVYLPPGTYLVSSILVLRRPFVLFGEPSNRPKIQLAASSSYFASGSNPFIIPDSGWMHAYNDYTTWDLRGSGTYSSTNDDFDEFFRDIDVEVLSSNTGCTVGVDWCGAQNIAYRNSVITVTSDQTAALQWGVNASGDSGSGGGIVANITTNGGQSALIEAGGSYAAFRGCTFHGPVSLNSATGQNSFIACTFDNPYPGTGFSNNYGPFTMDDCVFTTGTPFTRVGNNWHIENSGVAGSVIAQETNGSVYYNGSLESGTSTNLAVSGVVKGSPYANPSYPYAPASTINITSSPYNAVSGTDCTTAINSALSVPGASIYFPPGSYTISSNITVGANQSLYGNASALCSIIITNGAKVAVTGNTVGPVNLVDIAFTTDGVTGQNQLMTWDGDPSSQMLDCQLHPILSGTGPVAAFRSGGGFIEQGLWEADGSPGMNQGPAITSTTGPFYFYAIAPEHYSVMGWSLTNAQNVFIRPLDFEIIETTGSCISVSGGNNINIAGAIAGFPSSGTTSYIATLTNSPKLSLWVPYIYNTGCQGVVLEGGTTYGSGAAGTILPGYVHPSTVTIPSVPGTLSTGGYVNPVTPGTLGTVQQ